MTDFLTNAVRQGRNLTYTLLLTAIAVTGLFFYASSHLGNEVVGNLRYRLIKSGIGPWAKEQAVLNKYEKALAQAGYENRAPLIKVAASVSRPLSEIVQEKAKKHKVNKNIIDVVMSKESASGHNPGVRFEQIWMETAKKMSSDPLEQRMWASSHGPMQIAGWWVREYNKQSDRFRGEREDWSELYDLDYNIELGTLILKQCLEKNSRLPRTRQIWQAFRCYNGSGDRADKYANDAYRRLADRLISQIS